MARKKHLINVHTSTGTTAPTGASLYLGEIAVQHTPNEPALWIKVGTSEASTDYEKFIGSTEIQEMISSIGSNNTLGSGYTYSGLPYVNSATTIADAYSALTYEMIKDEKVTSAALNNLNDRVTELSGNVTSISTISGDVMSLSAAVMTISGNSGGGGVTGAVRYDEAQQLTETQQMQARKNQGLYAEYPGSVRIEFDANGTFKRYPGEPSTSTIGWYKSSDAIIPKTDVVGQKMMSNGSEINITSTMCVDGLKGYVIYIDPSVSSGPAVLVALENGAQLDGASNLDAGVWLYKSSSTGKTDWVEYEGTVIDKIPERFLPEIAGGVTGATLNGNAVTLTDGNLIFSGVMTEIEELAIANTLNDLNSRLTELSGNTQGGVVPEMSTNISQDRLSMTKTAAAAAVYNEVHPRVASSQPGSGMFPNVAYFLGTLTGNTTFTFATPVDNNVLNHYFFTFETDSTAPTITWPSEIRGWVGGVTPTINANKAYQVSVIDGYAIIAEF